MYAGCFSLEDFDRAGSSPFMPSRAATNVLNCLSSDQTAKQEITRCIVTSLSTRDSKCLRTEFHVSWAMECLGYAFSLPIDQQEVIQKAVNVYTAWLSPVDRPECISSNESFYQREILCHFSLLFVERQTYPQGGLQKHVDLCKATLLAIRALALRSDLARETWNTLLKVLLLIAKPLLSPITSRELATQLSPLLFRVLLEVWVRSNTREQSLWLELQDCFAMWTHHIWLVRHWGAVVLGLTQRVISFMYSYGSQKVKIQFSSQNPASHIEPLELDLQIEQVVYLWYQLLSIMLNNTKEQGPNDPEIHYKLARKVACLVDCFLEVCINRNDSRGMESPTFTKSLTMSSGLFALYKEFEKQHFQYLTHMARLPVPSADGILGLFGSWLFAYAEKTHGYEKGRAQAIGTLCRILSLATGPVREELLARFYSISAVCSKAPGLLASAYLRDSKGLLAKNHKGIRQLLVLTMVPEAVEKCLLDTNADLSTRKDCYSMLGSYVALPYYFLSLPFLATQERIPHLFIQIYEGLEGSVKTTLLQALEGEKDSEQLRTLCWLICVYLATAPKAEDLPRDDLDNYVRFVHGIAIRLEAASDWQHSVDLIEVLTSLAHLLRSKNIGDTRCVVGPLVMRLCQMVESKAARPRTELQVSALIMCLLAWLICFPTVFQDPDLRNRCLQVTSKEVVKSCWEEANFFQQFLLTRLALQIPAIPFGQAQDMIFSVSAPKLTVQGPDLPCKYYIIGKDALVTIYDSSKYNEDCDEALIVVRDCIGRFAWKAQVVYRTNSVPAEVPKSWFTLRELGKNSVLEEQSDPSIEAALIAQFSDTEKDDFAKFSELTKKQRTIDFNFLSNRPNSSPVSTEPRANRSKTVSKTHRMLLSSLGILTLSNADSVALVEGQEVASALRTLDRLSERDTHYLTVLYLRFPEMMDTTLGNERYSSSFQAFMRNMGIKVSSEGHNSGIYEHLSELMENIGAFLYTGDFSFEFVTISPAIMPADKLRGFSYQRLTQYSEVTLLWNERFTDPFSDKMPQILENAYIKKQNVIIVSPLGNGLCRIQLALKRYTPGPLQDHMVVPEVHLAQLVIRMVISIVGSVHSNRTSLVKRRRETLEALAIGAKKGNKIERVAGTFVQALRA